MTTRWRFPVVVERLRETIEIDAAGGESSGHFLRFFFFWQDGDVFQLKWIAAMLTLSNCRK